MKPDFLTLTAVAMAIYFFYFPEHLRRSGFRYLTGVLGISIAYDLVWIFLITDYADKDSSADAREASVRLFSLRVSYVSLIWRVSSLKFSLTFVGYPGPSVFQAIAKFRKPVQRQIEPNAT